MPVSAKLKENLRKTRRKVARNLRNSLDHASTLNEKFGDVPKDVDGFITQLLKERYPHGHPSYINFLVENAKLHSTKNHSYAHDGPALGNFQRVASIMRNYPNFNLTNHVVAVAVSYLMKHFDSMMWDLNNDILPRDEVIADIATYCTIIRCMIKDSKDRGKTFGIESV